MDTLGLERVSTYRSEKENVDEDVLRIGSGPTSVEVDIMQVHKPHIAISSFFCLCEGLRRFLLLGRRLRLLFVRRIESLNY